MLFKWFDASEAKKFGNEMAELISHRTPVDAKDKKGDESTTECVVVWTNQYRQSTKVFATTLGHNNDTVGYARYLDLITRGLLWSCDTLNSQYLKK